MSRLSNWGARALSFCGMWDLSSRDRDQTLVPCIARQMLSRWTTRAVSGPIFIKKEIEVQVA